MKDVIVILGATASGKSGAALELSKHIDCELISADSMQIYRGMDIGTAKPSKAEQEKVNHHMIDIVDVDEPFSVAQFQTQALKIVNQLHETGKTPVVVGGTGLYINSIVYNLDFTHTPSDTHFRDKMTALKAEKGLSYLYNLLEKQDKASASRIHPNDEKRIVRRLEVLNNEDDDEYDFLNENNDYNFKIFGLNYPRAVLYERINARVDIMVDQGLVDEVKALYAQYGDTPIALKAIGYKEIIAAIKGETDMDTAVNLIKRNSRRFAKRQITWFKRDNRIIWLDAQEKKCFNKLLSGIK